jgi:hypothetical protein
MDVNVNLYYETSCKIQKNTSQLRIFNVRYMHTVHHECNTFFIAITGTAYAKTAYQVYIFVDLDFNNYSS